MYMPLPYLLFAVRDVLRRLRAVLGLEPLPAPVPVPVPVNRVPTIRPRPS